MKGKKISLILVGLLIGTMVLNPYASNVKNVSATVISADNDLNSLSQGSVLSISDNSVYLSDIDYDTNLSYTKWKNIMRDTNSNGNSIQLKIDGEVVTFTKGMGAHATSEIVYDISEYSNKYTRLSACLGVDYSQLGKGNGVKFTIYTSDDCKNWTPIKESGVLTPTDNSLYVDLNVEDVKYIKLYASDNGSNANDHAVYADARLITKDYDLSSENTMDDIYKTSYYDSILKNNTIENNIENNGKLILQRALVNRVGYYNLQNLYKKSEANKVGIDFLVNNERALKYFITNGEATINGSYNTSISSFCNIYNKYKSQLEDSSDNYFNLRMAISISLAHSNDNLVRSWLTTSKISDAVERYEAYQKLISSGAMDEGGNTTTSGKWSSEQFKALPIPLMKWAVDTRLNNDEIQWLADYALKKKAEKPSSDYLNAYSYINYTMGYNYNDSKYYDNANFETYDNKYNFSKYYSNYGDTSINRLWVVFEEGSVCGGLAKTYANLAEVFGRPSSVVAQPGHAATLTYGWNANANQYGWLLQNDVSGWAKSANEYSDRMLNWGNKSWSSSHSASYVTLATDAIETEEAYDKFIQATMLNLLADSYYDLNTKEQIYRQALSIQNINLDSFEGLVNVYKSNSNKTSGDYLNLAKMIINAYTYYPLAMSDLLNYISGGVTDSNDIVLLDLLRSNALNKAKVATTENVKQPDVSIKLATFLLGKTPTDLATFSFDGENAGSIMINDKYNDSEIRIKYSLDGQKTWKETSEHNIKLSLEELAKINSSNDIVVGLVGANEVFTIDIKEGTAATNSTLYRNDLENKLFGKTDNLVVSLDNGKTWCDYTSDMRFIGNQEIQVKYKANNIYLESPITKYSFTEDTDTATKKYITIDHLSVIDYSSKTNDSESGEKVISGSANDGWHSAANDSRKFITLKLDSVKYITAIDYMSSFTSGKIKNADIYTSLDGVNWTKSGSVSDWKNNSNVKTATLDEPTAARYVKLVATETHGGNSYFTCKMLNFYEDTTKTYSVEDISNEETDKPNVDDTEINSENI